MSDIQRDREERQHVIEVLQKMVDWMESINYIVATPERRHALFYAIASIKTDLKYDLLYEETSGQADKPTTKNDLVVDCISRAEAIKCLECDFDITGKENMKTVVNYINSAHDKIVNLPSVTPIRPKGHWIPIYQGDEIIDYRCSECEFGNTFGRGTFGMDFCPRCGADMREVVEE